MTFQLPVEAMKVAKKVAEGDQGRIQYYPDGSIIVWNSATQRRMMTTKILLNSTYGKGVMQ